MIKLRITTHSGDDLILEVPEYDAEEITKQRNEEFVYAIQLGDASLSKIDIKNIFVLSED